MTFHDHYQRQSNFDYKENCHIKSHQTTYPPYKLGMTYWGMVKHVFHQSLLNTRHMSRTWCQYVFNFGPLIDVHTKMFCILSASVESMMKDYTLNFAIMDFYTLWANVILKEDRRLVYYFNQWFDVSKPNLMWVSFGSRNYAGSICCCVTNKMYEQNPLTNSIYHNHCSLFVPALIKSFKLS